MSSAAPRNWACRSRSTSASVLKRCAAPPTASAWRKKPAPSQAVQPRPPADTSARAPVLDPRHAALGKSQGGVTCHPPQHGALAPFLSAPALIRGRAELGPPSQPSTFLGAPSLGLLTVLDDRDLYEGVVDASVGKVLMVARAAKPFYELCTFQPALCRSGPLKNGSICIVRHQLQCFRRLRLPGQEPQCDCLNCRSESCTLDVLHLRVLPFSLR